MTCGGPIFPNSTTQIHPAGGSLIRRVPGFMISPPLPRGEQGVPRGEPRGLVTWQSALYKKTPTPPPGKRGNGDLIQVQTIYEEVRDLVELGGGGGISFMGGAGS